MGSIKKAFLELLYPKSIKCCICGRTGREAVCSSCLAGVEFLEGRVCLKCGKGIDDNYDETICPDCIAYERHFDLAFSCFKYDDRGREIIHKLKYEGGIKVSEVLGRLMTQRLRDENILPEVIVPVPIHKTKEASRGFNQALLVAEDIASRMNRPLWNCLLRTKETSEQFKLDRMQRIMNVHNAFCLDLLYNKLQNKSVLLVDDIFTTGSTVDECSKVLKKHGASTVYIITAATGSNT